MFALDARFLAQWPYMHTDSISATQITRRSWLPLFWLVTLAVTAVFFPHRVWNTLLVGSGGLYGLAYLWAYQLGQHLHAARELQYGWVAVGDRLQETFTLYNNSQFPALWVEIIDQSNVPGYTVNVVRSVSYLSQERWRQAAICGQRGQFHLGPWAIRSGDPFGLFQVMRHYPDRTEIIIHPPIHGQLPVPLPVGESDGRIRARQRSWRATVNATTVRDYRPNDPYTWIHWRTTARRGHLFVREFDLDAAGDIWLLLDMETAVQLGQGLHGSEEHLILLAAALAAQALNQNRPIGLAGYGQLPHILPPGLGEGQRWRLMRALALLHADGSTPLHRALQDLRGRIRRGTAVLIFTPNGTADWLPDLLTLTRQGIQSHVILLDRASFGDPQANPSQNLRQMIRHLGITCQIIRQGEVGHPLTAESHRGFWEFKVTGLGKVIAVQTPEGNG